MEREIKEDFTLYWPAFYGIGAVVVAFVLVAGGVSSIFILHDWQTFAFLVGVSIFTIWFVRFGLRTALERAKASQRRWLLTDAGLTRCYDLDKRETIHWEQIRDMRWGRHLGVKVSWEESKHDHRLPEFRDEFRKPQTGRYWCWILVGENEAREIFHHAKRDWVDMRLWF